MVEEAAQLGIDYTTLRTAPFLHLMYYLDGARKAKEQEHQERWEQTRFIVHGLLQPHTAKGKKLRPEDIVQFPWEVEGTVTNPVEKAKNTAQLIERLKQEGKIKHGFSVKNQR